MFGHHPTAIFALKNIRSLLYTYQSELLLDNNYKYVEPIVIEDHE